MKSNKDKLIINIFSVVVFIPLMGILLFLMGLYVFKLRVNSVLPMVFWIAIQMLSVYFLIGSINA